MHNQLGSSVTLTCHIHLGGALKMIRYKEHAVITKGNMTDHTQVLRYHHSNTH